MWKIFGSSSLMRPASVLLIIALAVAILGGAAVSLQASMSDDPKAVLDAQMDAARAAAIQQAEEHPELQPSKIPTLWPTGTPEPWPQGLFQRGPAPFPSSEYVFESTWQWDLNGHHVQIYAGREGVEGATPGRGIIILRATALDLQPLPGGGRYLAPYGVGTLKIVSYEGTLLTLEASTGETFFFDALTRAFTDAGGTPVPTDTPAPTPEQLPTTTATLPPFPFPTDTEPAQTASAVPAPSGVAD
jgi:hypothetical protein